MLTDLVPMASLADLPPASGDTQALGIDVSHWDGAVQWAAVLESGISFAFCKATEGDREVDLRFADNWRRMHEVGITAGVYHFFDPSVGGVDQAEHLLSTVTLLPTDLPFALDLEEAGALSPADCQTNVQHWLDLVEQHTGKVPIIYGSPDFLVQYLGERFGRYPLWIAEYQVSAPRVPVGWSTWTMWQYTDNKSGQVKVPGIVGAVDANRFSGTHDELIARFGLRA